MRDASGYLCQETLTHVQFLLDSIVIIWVTTPATSLTRQQLLV